MGGHLTARPLFVWKTLHAHFTHRYFLHVFCIYASFPPQGSFLLCIPPPLSPPPPTNPLPPLPFTPQPQQVQSTLEQQLALELLLPPYLRRKNAAILRRVRGLRDRVWRALWKTRFEDKSSKSLIQHRYSGHAGYCHLNKATSCVK